MIININALDYKTKIKWMYEKLMMSETCILYTEQSNVYDLTKSIVDFRAKVHKLF